MLEEERTARLLHRCEAIAGRRLDGLRSELRDSKSRAQALWRLLVVDAAARLGTVEYWGESHGADVRLFLPATQRWAWLETAYLYPRYKRQRYTRVVFERWLREAIGDADFDAPEVTCGFVQKMAVRRQRVRLPQDNQRHALLRNPQVRGFLELVRACPSVRHEVIVSAFALRISAEPVLATGSRCDGPVADATALAPPGDDGAFRVLRRTRHRGVGGEPTIVCIGSDLEPFAVAAHPGEVRRAVDAMFRPAAYVSGALLFAAQRDSRFHERLTPQARAVCYANARSDRPLAEQEWRLLAQAGWSANHAAATEINPAASPESCVSPSTPEQQRRQEEARSTQALAPQ